MHHWTAGLRSWFPLLAAVAVLLPPVAARADLHPRCELLPVQPGGGNDVDLGDRYVGHVSAAPPVDELAFDLLVLARDGELLQEIPVQDGDVFQIAVRDQVQIREHRSGPFDWKIHAPGTLFRVVARRGFVSEVAYCSPYAAIRVDRPVDPVFVKTVLKPLGGVHLTVGLAQMKPESVKILVDCVDIVSATGAVFPGGPFSGTATIANTLVQIEDVVGDLDRGTVSFSLLGLPGGTHVVHVEGTPVYVDVLPPGHVNWKRPLGVLEHEREILVFATEITSPADGEILPFAPTPVTGTITHGLPVDSLRLYGADVPLPPAQLIPGDGCFGDSLRVEFAATLPVASLGQDFASGNDALSALDPADNYIMALATDGLGHVSNDRVQVALGDVETGGLQVLSASANGDSCEATPPPLGHAENGFAVSLSERALSTLLSAQFLPLIQSEVSATLDGLVGQTLSALSDPCTDTSPLPPAPPPPGAPAPGPDAPVWTPIDDANVKVLGTFAVGLAAVDPNSDPVQFQASTVPDNSTIGTNDMNVPTFFFTPSCTQIGGPHPVALVATDGTNESTESFNVTVDPPEELEIDGEITKVEYDVNSFAISAAFPNDSEIAVDVRTGALRIETEAEKCIGDCGLLCCIEIDLDVNIELSDLAVGVTLTPEQALCGIDGDPLPVMASVGDIDVDVASIMIGGLLGWLNPQSLTNRIVEFFGMQQILVEAIAEPHIKEPIRMAIEDAVENNFPEDLLALNGLEFDPALPSGIPMTLDGVPSNIGVIEPHTAISTGVHSLFEADPAVDPAPRWQKTTSTFPHAGIPGADVMIGVSDDALDQMATALVATGTLRDRFTGLTIGDVAAGLSIPTMGLPASTPIVLTIDAAQVADNRPIAPIIAFVDDPSTPDILEVIARVQMAVRGVLPRGNPGIGDDRLLCDCTDLRPACQGTPCVIYESVLKLNLLTNVTLTEEAGPTATLFFDVTQLQQLARDEGFNSYEAMDYRLDEADIVDTSSTSPLLDMLRQALNARIPPFAVPSEALTLGGFVTPTNLRLFSATMDAAGYGDQDYGGIVGDVAP